MDIHSYLEKKSKTVDKALEQFLPAKKAVSSNLQEAMRYAVFPGGKRIRPVLALAACEAVGGSEKSVISAACALELIHSYSLVHDDLPCMDNDELRRGKDTCHKKFGEVTALLAGDALLTLAFQILSTTNGQVSSKDFKRSLGAISMIAEAVGVFGMVGGQAMDMESQDKEIDLPTIECINTHKSGALIAASIRVGAYLGGGSEKEVKSLTRFGKTIGLLFQIVDDVMDNQGYAQVMGIKPAKEEARHLLLAAKSALKPFGKKARNLEKIADFIFERNN